jgi:hypothetical protein
MGRVPAVALMVLAAPSNRHRLIGALSARTAKPVPAEIRQPEVQPLQLVESTAFIIAGEQNRRGAYPQR